MNGVARSALAVALLAGTAAACSSPAPARPSASPAAATSSAPAASPSPEAQAVTVQEATRALKTFLATDDVLRSAGADRWTLALTRDGQRPITAAQIHSYGATPPHYSWTRPRVFVPRQGAKTPLQWFAATAERHSSSGEVRTAVLAFTRPNPKSPWQNSFESLIYPGDKPPDVSLDADGYATALDSRDESIAISPNLMGPLHATVAEDGPRGFASGLIAPGPQTTGYSADIGAAKEKAQSDDGMQYQSLFAVATTYPVFALRTEGGGALMLYTLIRTSTWSPSQGLMFAKGRPVTVPAQARWMLKDPFIINERVIEETQQYVSAVPPKASTAPAYVIGYDGLVTKATTR
ncbi:hypothetical protein Pth03_17410 [Planotetraspora thailandica]|uniref:DUF8094 domain-containing protein n=1 Tax=Planotetraspora thailandica TaxID=487172 RepID=A0A8J3V0M6_9ACTN|nr:hypothetical protein [Planotetraspora thailandica]GII53352.1 hypothetical protein Pth03_17410 [Planotetraspora thailandica]